MCHHIFLFLKEIFFSFNLRCNVCTMNSHINKTNSNWFSCLLKSNCYSRGKLIWKSNSSPMIYKVNTTLKTWNIHAITMVLNLNRREFFTLCTKEISKNQLWGNVIYRGIITVAFLWSWQYALTNDFRSRQPVENLLKSWKEMHLRAFYHFWWHWNCIMNASYLWIM